MTNAETPRIAVRAPNWLGDCIMAIPALRALAATFVDGDIHVYVRAGLESVLRRALDGVPVFGVPADRAALLRDWPRRLRRERYDAGVVLPPSVSSAFGFHLGGVHTLAGHGEGRGPLVRLRVPRVPRGERHLADEYVDVAARLASHLERSLTRVTVRPLAVSETERAAVRERYATEPAPWIVLAPGALYGDTKRWPADRFGALAARLAEVSGGRVFLTGTAEDRPHAEAVARAAGVSVRNVAGDTTLDDLIALLSEASLVVSNDSGTMHVADALHAPLVALFGSTNPAWTGPRGRNASVVRHVVPCAPCYARTCPIGIVCLTELTVGDVFEACRSRLSEAG